MKYTMKPMQDTFEWHRWFAWYPVVIGHQVFWLEYVEQQEYGSWGGGGWEYREAS